MDQTVNLGEASLRNYRTSGAALEISIQSASKQFDTLRSPKGAKAILGKLKNCFAALPGILAQISAKSVQLLVRMTICALQTQTTLDDDLRQIICRGASCLKDKHLAQQLLQETAPQTLAQNSEWIEVLKHQNIQRLQPKDVQSLERITFCLENAAKFVSMAPEAVAVFNPFLIEGESGVKAMISAKYFLGTDPPSKTFAQTKSVAFSLKLHTPSTSTKMVEEISVPERLFTCDFCQKTFSLWKSLVQHIRHHSRGSPHKCNVCSKAFPYSSHLVKHIRTHTGEKPFACSFCDKSFSHKSTLVGHKRIHTGERPFKCNYCPKMFTQSEHQVLHTRTHTGEKPFICSVCHKGFTQSSNLKVHSRTHTGEKSYTCKFCQKSFLLLGNLKKHERIHTGERPYKCNHCTKMFAHSESLVVHTRLHTGEKPFVCSVCQKGFTQSNHLKNHSRTHSGEKPYTCDICNKSFTRSETLNKHNKRIHTRKASDLQLQGSPTGQDSVPIAPSASPSKQPSAKLVCNPPDQLVAMDLSRPGSLPSRSLDSPEEKRRVSGEKTPLKRSTIFLQRYMQELDNLSS